MQFFYVLKKGTSWKTASSVIMKNESYNKTLNRRFNQLVKNNIFNNTYNEIQNNYIKNNTIDEVYIDSTDIQNNNCNKSDTYKSFKLNKQAMRLSIIADKYKTPLTYSINPAYNNDSHLGFELAKTLNLNDNKEHYLVGDKGYYMNDFKKDDLLKNNKLKLLVPKKKYKTKNNSTKTTHIYHSIYMKQILKNRIIIEHTNSIIHRSFKRVHQINEKTKINYDAFVKLAIICMIIRKSI
jgi:hypothetical protein